MDSLKKEKKFNWKMIVIVVVVVALLVLACWFLFTKVNKGNNKKELETSLSEMGKGFYENFYYEQIGSSSDERSSLLSKFSNIGIKVDLENLSRYNNGEFKDKISEFKNNKTNENCNKTNTKVIIYPKSPYGKTDYTTKVELDCGFEEK